MSATLSFPVFVNFAFSTATNSRESKAVLEKNAAGNLVVKSRIGIFSSIPSWVNHELSKMKTYSLNDAECYSMCTFREMKSKSKTWRSGTELMDILGANNKTLPSVKAAGRKRVLSAISEADAAAQDDDPADSDYVPSDSEEADDDHEFDENVVSEPEDDEPGTEPEDDVLTDGDYESDPAELAKKVVARTKAKRSEPPKPVSMKRTDLMSSAEFQQRIGTLVARVAKRVDTVVRPGMMAPRRNEACTGRCRARAPYNSPALRPIAPLHSALNAEDMMVVDALLSLKSGAGFGSNNAANNTGNAPRMEVLEITPAALPTSSVVNNNNNNARRRSARIANKKSH